MNELMEKFKSRKFLTSLVGVILGLAMIFGLDQGEITNVAGAVTALGSIVVYVVSEAKVDAAAVKANNDLNVIGECVKAVFENPKEDENVETK